MFPASFAIHILLLLTFQAVFQVSAQTTNGCWQREFKGGKVCVCNSDYCDNFPPIEPVSSDKYLAYTSSKDGLRFKKYEGYMGRLFTDFKAEIKIDHLTRYQEMFGFGGTFTDGNGINMYSLKANARKLLMRSYFSEDGIQYSLCRVPIGCTDAGNRPYTYNDGAVDTNLTNFNLQPEDYAYKIPLIQEALNLTNNDLKLIGSTWAAPKWMKTNNEYHGQGYLKKDMYQVWANYFVKFFDEYKKENITFWALTTQNEPSLGYIFFLSVPTVMWKPEEVAKWVANNLGPTIRNSSHADLKIICLDDHRPFLPWFVEKIFANPQARQYIDGIGVHWYFNKLALPYVLSSTKEKFPDKFFVNTEACHRNNFERLEPFIGSWDRGADYAADIIESIENWSAGWIDWNMALDMIGGPTYLGDFNLLDAPVLVNATAGEFYKQPMFYVMGHFSKFIRPGSIRIGIKISDSRLQAVAFERPDNATVIVVHNRNFLQAALTITDNRGRKINFTVPTYSINSIIYWD